MSSALPLLFTQRLQLRASEPALAAAVLDFQQRNLAHFAPWDPPLPAGFLNLEHQEGRMEESALLFERGEGFRWWLCLPPPDPSFQPLPPGRFAHNELRVVGTVNISNPARGPFQSASLGYALDAEWQGQGLMREAAETAIQEVFSPRVNLHRLQAAWRPENHRSGAVLARLGFATIGLARDYLFIHGAWRDHVLTERLNPMFEVPAAWR